MMISSAPAARRSRAVESFRSASETIGPVVPGISVFAITRGQFSMIDAVLHAIEACAPARVSLWTWTVADYEIQQFTSLLRDGRISEGRLVIDHGARNKNLPLIEAWQASFGDGSVRFVLNHAKIATVEGNGMRVCMRGSMNLNNNPRFEQLDVTEGGGDFDLIRQIEDDLPTLPNTATGAAVWKASKVSDAFSASELAPFRELKRWNK